MTQALSSCKIDFVVMQNAQLAQLVEQRTENPRVSGSIPELGITCGCSSMVEHQPSKLDTWVRFPSPALRTDSIESVLFRFRNFLQKRHFIPICSCKDKPSHPLYRTERNEGYYGEENRF